MTDRRNAKLLTALLCATVLLASPAGAKDDDGKMSLEAVRGAVERGEIRSLASILEAVRDKLPGEITGVEIERKKGRWLYELRVVGQKGRLYEVYVDAKSGLIERVKEK
jgi:uncharacterized membrane protein YkoI